MKRRTEHAAWIILLLALTARAGEHTAVLEWSQRVDLSTPLSGIVASVQALPGQTVEAGALLLGLDATPYKAQVAEARAETDRLAEDEADARRELKRAEELYARTVTATTELDAARLKHARTTAALAAAQARLERARWQLAQTEVRAPFPALILERRAEPGMTVAAQCQPPILLRIARADEIIARTSLSPRQASNVRPGMKAEVVHGGKSHPGVVRAVNHAGTDAAEYTVDVAIPREAGMMAGLTASLRLLP
ncbi:MAG: efflux RND transporter periplasmic adaptor subunit [Thiobacillaceae bacterium]